MGNKNKRNLQKPSNSDKPKKAKTIEIEDTPYGKITLPNTSFNQVIKRLFSEAKKGNFLYTGYMLEDHVTRLNRLKEKGLKARRVKKGNFSQQFFSEVSWEKAFENFDESELDSFQAENYTKEEAVLKFLPQILYRTTCRAIEKMKENGEHNPGSVGSSPGSNDYR